MSGELVLYTTEDGEGQIALKALDGTVWLTQAQLAVLFQTSVSNINQHIKAILSEGEQAEGTIKSHLIVQTEGSRDVERLVSHYSLPMILAIGFRVRSPRGLQFRRWAATTLETYLVKGFVMDDAKLKDPDADYFEELLGRIRDIRSSEKLFYRKILEIYATSMDYDPKSETSERFFQTMQNKMHWAAHGKTAAEVVHSRADAERDNMGMTTWTSASRGGSPTKRDAVVAKNYLNHEEMETLNRIVTAYLEFAELQALNRRPMYMTDWVAKLDDFLKLSDRDILTHAGSVSASNAKTKAEAEYEQWRGRLANEQSAVERHFEEAVAETKKVSAAKKLATAKASKRK